MVFLLKFQQLSLVLPFGRGVIPGTFRNYSRKKPQGGQIWHFWSLELDNQNISNFRPSLYATKKQTHGKYELELILQKQCIFFEEHNGPWAVSKAPSHFLFTYSKNYKTSKVEGGTSEWVLCCSHISNTLCGLQPSQRVFSEISIYKADVQLLYHLPCSLSLQRNNWATPCPNILPVTEEVQVSFCCVCPTIFASHPDP